MELLINEAISCICPCLNSSVTMGKLLQLLHIYNGVSACMCVHVHGYVVSLACL